MKRPKLTAADVLARLAPTDLHLADDDDLLAGVERAIENITDPQAALAYAIAFRSGLRSGPSANAAEPVPAPASPVAQASINEAREQARQAGATAERARLRAILTCPLSADRWDAARHLAFHTSMTAPEAIALLQTVKPATPADALKSLPAHIARACNSPTGLVGFNAQAGTIETVEAGASSAGASIGFAPAPDPFAKADPNAKHRDAWKRTTSTLNAEADHAIRG